MARPLKGRRGLGRGHKEKKTFLKTWTEKFPKNVATKLEGGGNKALVAGPQKNVFVASINNPRNESFTNSKYVFLDELFQAAQLLL